MGFSFRIGDLEVRSCNDNLLSDGTHTKAEIIKWESKENGSQFCYTLAYWNKSEEGFDLKFVGNRPFDVDSDLFMKLSKIGQEILDEFFM